MALEPPPDETARRPRLGSAPWWLSHPLAIEARSGAGQGQSMAKTG